MKETITLSFPSGEFTHTELAQANGKTNQQVWTAYQKAIKDGVIVFVGNKSTGKGKPSKYWKVADGQPISLVDKVEVVRVKPVETEKTEMTNLDELAEQRGLNKPAKTEIVSSLVSVADSTVALLAEVDKALPVVAPTVAPVVETVEVIQPVPVVRNLTCQVTEIDAVCPFCQTKLLSVETSGGYKVWCPVNDLKVCSCSENPYGVSNNVKNAVEILNDKFKHR